jgi:hypothetical protein
LRSWSALAQSRSSWETLAVGAGCGALNGIISDSSAPAKTKLADGFNLLDAWLHGWITVRYWRDPGQSAM